MAEAEVKTRGRPRGFDEETALDELMDLFWTKGYTRTSVADMVEVSGVHKPSLYRIFGSKEELFATILRRYHALRLQMLAQLAGSVEAGARGLHQFLDLLADDIISGSSGRGCLLVLSSLELGGTTPGFENFGPRYRSELRAIMSGLVTGAGGDAQVAETRTDVLVTWLLGLDVIIRGAGSEAEIRAAVDAMRAEIDSW
ncbi:MAG: TetR/AcrR family transcriptional regulator [Acidimicrobiia bacterium]|nr:TetR/AcrR family transcriptional regulator [Acidimicrobiia bacterium]